MKRVGSEQVTCRLPEDPARTTEPSATDAPLLMIEELEPRLTPDGPFGSSTNNSQPPGGQVGWGC
jgi:hypothetical protein